MESKSVIVCVDDEKIVLNSLQSVLSRKLGKTYELEFAESGEEALEILTDFEDSSSKLIVFITDWLMPNMKGDELLYKVKKKFPNTKTILLSGQIDWQADHMEEVKTWLDYFIAKPWTEEELISRILK